MPGTSGNGGVAPGEPRVKHPRSRSPVPSTSQSTIPESRPPTKRARKAINCEPCRNSKLKCDRNRPCSSCILRGTTALCYQGQDQDPNTRSDENQQNRTDPGIEINNIRRSLSLLESYIYQPSNPRLPNSLPAHLPSSTLGPSTRPPPHPHPQPDTYAPNEYLKEPPEQDTAAKSRMPHISNAPGMLGQQGSGGLYSGPTSAVSHLMTASENEESDPPEAQSSLIDRPYSDMNVGTSSSTRATTPSNMISRVPYDDDLLALLPPTHIVDGLIEYYFEYCNWVYRHVNQTAFLAGWARYKSGEGGDRLILATVCIIIALSTRYLPLGHPLMLSLNGTVEDVGFKYYDIMLDALYRYRTTCRREGRGKGYTLDLVELLLVRSHYLTFAKEDPEETWSVRGELISIGTALGLHRDPGNIKFGRGVAERRRWAWWHILLLERWQAFMFGRPPAISSRHYNTRLPSYCEPELDSTGRLYQPNLALFRLACVLGEIMDDAVSFKAVPYSCIQEHDKQLIQWMESLPNELDLDEYHIARALASPTTSVRRLGVQSVIIRTAYHHIRFTLHRPYAHIASSLETAVSAASQLITLVGQTRPDFLSNTALAVPGHMNWGPFHVFSAAMFFSFQLISNPDQPAAKLFRENVRKAIVCLEQSRSMPVADKALSILQALAPLYSDEFLSESQKERERRKRSVLRIVKKLAFPYQDAPIPSPLTRSEASSSPQQLLRTPETPNSSTGAVSPYDFNNQLPLPVAPQTQLPVSSMRWVPHPELPPSHIVSHSPDDLTNDSRLPPTTTSSSVLSGTNVPLIPPSQLSPAATHGTGSSTTNIPNSMYSNSYSHSIPVPSSIDIVQSGALYTQPADEGSMWGASMGFGVGEWTQFLNAMQQPDRVR
ncbi:hypothetical protein C8Q75DRAFT_771832 [Abortiporus biennis]|nr:hypothetical protein C8Q75DRAFT_771832 [Abortiporus biennis]